MVSFLTSLGNKSLYLDSKNQVQGTPLRLRLGPQRHTEGTFHEHPLVFPQLTHL